MVPKVSATLRALHEIRDEIKEVRGEVRELRTDVQTTNARVSSVETAVSSLERRQTETEVRLATELASVAHAVIEVRDLLRDRSEDHHRIDDHERRIQVLERGARRR